MALLRQKTQWMAPRPCHPHSVAYMPATDRGGSCVYITGLEKACQHQPGGPGGLIVLLAVSRILQLVHLPIAMKVVHPEVCVSGAPWSRMYTSFLSPNPTVIHLMFLVNNLRALGTAVQPWGADSSEWPQICSFETGLAV